MIKQLMTDAVGYMRRYYGCDPLMERDLESMSPEEMIRRLRAVELNERMRNGSYIRAFTLRYELELELGVPHLEVSRIEHLMRIIEMQQKPTNGWSSSGSERQSMAELVQMMMTV